MDYETYPDGFADGMCNSIPSPPPESLFEEQKPEETFSPLEGRVEAMEYRLGRALLCLDQCQKEQAGLQRQYRELAQEQAACQARQERRQRTTKYGMYFLTGLFLAAQAKTLAVLGWQLLDRLSALLNAEPTMTAGVLLAAVVLWLAAKLGQTLVRRLTSRRRKGVEGHTVCDR